MIVDIVDKYCTDDNNPIKNLRLKKKSTQGSQIQEPLDQTLLATFTTLAKLSHV